MNVRNTLTGEIAAHQRKIVEQEIYNKFMEQGTRLLLAGDLHGAVDVVHETHRQLKKYGIDVQSFLSDHQ